MIFSSLSIVITTKYYTKDLNELDVPKPICAAVSILWESYRTIVFTTDKVSLALIAPITVTLIDCTRCFTCTATSIIGLTITNFACKEVFQ